MKLKNLCAVGIVLACCSFAHAVKQQPQTVKIQIATPSEDRAVKYQNGGLIGAIQGVKTADVVFMVNAVIGGDHARLKCYENHRGCTALGPGEYNAEVDKDNVWVIIDMPVTHKLIRDHWKVSGTW
jgi:hypothetical protein